MSSWKQPVPYPVLTSSLCDELEAEAREAGDKAQAFETPFRFSGAHSCSRQLALRAAGIPATNPMDGPSLVVTTRGTLMHELVQDAIAKRFPGAQFELKGIIEDLTSGHCDALVEIDGVLVIWELKNVGAFKFDAAVGINRRAKDSTGKSSPKMVTPKGPSLGYVVQAGLNAIAHNAEAVVIAYISMEAVSFQLADKLGISGPDRIMAEWYVPREVWEPLALAEVARLKAIKASLDEGLIPEATAVDDFGRTESLDPNAGFVPWNCWYCSHKDLCKQLPRTPVAIQSVQAATGIVAV